MSERHGENYIFILTRDDLLACARELGISPRRVTDEVIELVKRRVAYGLRCWPELIKSSLREAIKCPLGLVCYPSCAWWKDARCSFSRKGSKMNNEGQGGITKG